MSSYTFGKSIALPFDAAVDRVASELAKEGFGVLSEVDVPATLKKRLGQDMPPYKILGACNPQFASQALAAEPQIGALPPCNVGVRVDAAGSTRVEFMKPNAVLPLVDHPEVARLVGAVRLRLGKVMDAL